MACSRSQTFCEAASSIERISAMGPRTSVGEHEQQVRFRPHSRTNRGSCTGLLLHSSTRHSKKNSVASTKFESVFGTTTWPHLPERTAAASRNFCSHFAFNIMGG